jgi:hypothetical protein
MPHAGVDLIDELRALAEASAAALARLCEGDERGVLELVERRERLLRALAAWPLEAGTAMGEEALRALALDGEILAVLRAHQAEVGRRLSDLGHARRSLVSYGATRPGSARYVERLG